MSSTSCPTGVTLTNILDLSPSDTILAGKAIDTATTYDIDGLYAGLTPIRSETVKKIKELVGYYNDRYKCAIERGMAGDSGYIVAATKLNRRLAVLSGLYGKIKGGAGAESLKVGNLNAEAAVLANMEDEYPRMVEYTREKAKVTNNLLQLYGFLNIVALGVIFYVYRST